MKPIDSTNKVINGLWIGKSLSNIELLTLHSFIAQGHTFLLWVYDDLDTPIPHGVELKNANEIIPHSQVFCYKNEDPTLKQGKGSYAGFSDIFRYKLLYEHGGWWVDMDVTCLKPFMIKEDYFFKYNTYVGATGNLMKCPPQSDLMRVCYEEAVAQIDENNQDWLVPIRILNENIKKKGLTNYIKKGFANEDTFEVIQILLYFSYKIHKKWHAVHWMNEAWRTNNISKSMVVQGSVFQNLLSNYGLLFSANEQNLPKKKAYQWYFRGIIYPNMPMLVRRFYHFLRYLLHLLRYGIYILAVIRRSILNFLAGK